MASGRLCPAPYAPPPTPAQTVIYQSACSVLTNTSGPFANCITFGAISVEAAEAEYDNCLLDAFYTNGSSICTSISAFVYMCANAGVQIPCDTWQTATGCGKT